MGRPLALTPVPNRVPARAVRSNTAKTAVSKAGGICQEGFTLSVTLAFWGLTPVFCSDATHGPRSGRFGGACGMPSDAKPMWCMSSEWLPLLGLCRCSRLGSSLLRRIALTAARLLWAQACATWCATNPARMGILVFVVMRRRIRNGVLLSPLGLVAVSRGDSAARVSSRWLSRVYPGAAAEGVGDGRREDQVTARPEPSGSSDCFRVRIPTAKAGGFPADLARVRIRGQRSPVLWPSYLQPEPGYSGRRSRRRSRSARTACKETQLGSCGWPSRNGRMRSMSGWYCEGQPEPRGFPRIAPCTRGTNRAGRTTSLTTDCDRRHPEP